MKLLRKMGMLLMLPVMAVMMSGCTHQDWLDLVDFAKLWAYEHGLATEDGNVDYVKAGTRALTGSPTGDEQADAVLDGGDVVKKSQEAEQLSNDASKTGNTEYIDKAIKLRPGEYRYYNQRAAMNLIDGNGKVEQDYREADEIAAKYGPDTQIMNIDSRINSLIAENTKYEALGQREDKITAKFYEQMKRAHYQRFLLTEDPEDKEAYENYKAAAQKYNPACAAFCSFS